MQTGCSTTGTTQHAPLRYGLVELTAEYVHCFIDLD